VTSIDRTKVACITGVSRGLGAALARDLLERGWDVVGLGRSADPSLAGARFGLVPADLADVGALEGIALRAFGEIAAREPAEVVLLNNAAAVDPVGPLGALEGAGIAASLAVNLVAPVILANAFVRAFAGRVPGRVINVSSGLAARALPGAGLYCVAKAGLEMLTAVVAAEAPTGVAAASVRPGIIDTPMQASLRRMTPDRLPPVAVFRDFHEQGRLQTPAETARFIVERMVLARVEDGAVISFGR
jgi:NAD(P)-dependent dehydrogenase (short-subunit alcohol dehydrogenase family)